MQRGWLIASPGACPRSTAMMLSASSRLLSRASAIAAIEKQRQTCTDNRAVAMLDDRTRFRSLQRDRWIDDQRAAEALLRWGAAVERPGARAHALLGDAR